MGKKDKKTNNAETPVTVVSSPSSREMSTYDFRLVSTWLSSVEFPSRSSATGENAPQNSGSNTPRNLDANTPFFPDVSPADANPGDLDTIRATPAL